MADAYHRRPERILNKEQLVRLSRIQAYIQYAFIGVITVFLITTLTRIFVDIPDSIETILIISGAAIGWAAGKILIHKYEPNLEGNAGK